MDAVCHLSSMLVAILTSIVFFTSEQLATETLVLQTYRHCDLTDFYCLLNFFEAEKSTQNSYVLTTSVNAFC